MGNQSSIVVSSCCALKTCALYLANSEPQGGVAHWRCPQRGCVKEKAEKEIVSGIPITAAGFLHFLLLALPPNFGHTPYHVASIPDAFAEVRTQERITMVDRVHEHHFISPIVTDHRDCPVEKHFRFLVEPHAGWRTRFPPRRLLQWCHHLPP